MMEMWKRYAEWLDAMTLRERVLIFAAGTVFLVAIAKIGFIDPQLSLQRKYSRSVGEQREAIQTAQEQIRKLASEQREDPNEVLRARISALKSEVGSLETAIAGEERRFTSPEQMRETLAAMLGAHQGLRLVDLKTLPTEPLVTGTGPSPRRVYRHGVELTIEGEYLSIHSYLVGLEALRSKLNWGRAELTAAYPTTRLKLTVYTMSVDPAWLIV